MGLNLAKLAELSASKTPVVETPKLSLNELMDAHKAAQAEPTKITPPVESSGNIKYDQVCGMITELQQRLLSSHPQMPKLLQEIWSTLDMYPECVTLLPEDQIEIIVSGLEKLVDVDLAQITLKAATSGGKKSKTPVSAASLGF